MMKAGEYYIGDLCYVMTDEEWDEMGDGLWTDSNTYNEGEFTFKDGRKVATYSTAQGDGTYHTSIGGVCWVDSGSIGCILKSDIRAEKYNVIGMAVFHTFESDFDTGTTVTKEYSEEYDMNYETKTLRFGDVEVYT